MKAIALARLIGCPNVDTTDGLHAPEAFPIARRST